MNKCFGCKPLGNNGQGKTYSIISMKEEETSILNCKIYITLLYVGNADFSQRYNDGQLALMKLLRSDVIPTEIAVIAMI